MQKLADAIRTCWTLMGILSEIQNVGLLLGTDYLMSPISKKDT